ncbi:MAG: phosphoribosylformylglycinamidine synthase [Treponema sp.]|jgi:phosphoribosylformylglycinamidine synthase|nr:phosphoribosylformylglycinamidine synthase [Treponema sp.]
MRVKRVYVEKKPGFDIEALRLRVELADFLGEQYPSLRGLAGLRILHRYDAAFPGDDAFEQAVQAVFSEPQCDRVFYGAAVPADKRDRYFGVEYVPGQYDQRSDSAEQCVELVTGVKPVVRTARIYILQPGDIPLPDNAVEAVKRYLINPVDSREARETMPDSLEREERTAAETPALKGFIDSRDPGELGAAYGLAMSREDLLLCRDYFASEGRDPTLAELRILDTYWSDHCRHTTFTTELTDITVADPAGTPEGSRLRRALLLYEEARKEAYGEGAADRKRTLMDMATLGARVLKKRGFLEDLDESREINAYTIRVRAEFGLPAGYPGPSGGPSASPGEEAGRHGALSPVSGTTELSSEPWLLLFKNETHNHPTEIEPFGGAATCLGGAIRDPLSGRAYVYQAMRISGGGDPRSGLAETLPGKLPQLKIAREAAGGYSSYGNQIGLATGQVAEFYHSGFIAKRMELGAVIAAVPATWVRREEPQKGDVIILVGGKTGRDGIGGATGSSKVHTGKSVETAGAEVQKGNAVEERKLQRLFRNPKVTRLIKGCNDFGAGGVSVAVGELAAGLVINLDAVPKKYAGLDGLELAISESQERMAVLTAPEDAAAFIAYAAEENLDACIIAQVSAGDQGPTGDQKSGEDPAPHASEEGGPRLRMTWQGQLIADLSRKFLNTSGASRSARVILRPGDAPAAGNRGLPLGKTPDNPEEELVSLRSGSRRGLMERFDGSIGAASVLFPWGGKEQGTPECGMAALFPALDKESQTASLMSFGYDPVQSARSPYQGAKGTIREALAKFACLGGDPWTARLSFQEYFERPEGAESWGKPAAALLGALEAQLVLGVPAIGGKDSMSGTYRDAERGIDLAVPPTLVAFAAGTVPAAKVRSGALSGTPGNSVILLCQSPAGGGEVPDEWEIFKANMDTLAALSRAAPVRSAYPVGPGGVAATLAVMAFGNKTGVEAEAATFGLVREQDYQGSVLAELDGAALGDPQVRALLERAGSWALAGKTLAEPVFRILNGGDPAGTGDEPAERGVREIPLAVLLRAYESPLSQVYPQVSAADIPRDDPPAWSIKPPSAPVRPARSRVPAGGRPLTVLPVFPGTNCEWDMERAFRRAGARTRLVIFKNRNREDIRESIRELAGAIGEAQIVALSGGFSAGDEPDGSGKFIATVFRAPAVAEAVLELLEKQDGLILGICNGFQALIKLGLVPYGTYKTPDDTMPTLTFNRIGRHVSRMVRTRVMSTRSPWLAPETPGAVHVVPVSHGEGRLVIGKAQGEELFKAGQVPFCYADAEGRPTLAEPDNPNGSDFAIEGLTSPDGRILGKMAHSERNGAYVHVNIPGNKRQRIFEAGVEYFR